MIVTFLLSSLPEGTQYDSDSESEPPTGTDSYVQYEYGNYCTRYLVRGTSVGTHSKVAGSTITIFIFLTVPKLNHNFKIFKNKYELPDLIASCVFDHVASLAASRRSNE